MKPALPFVLSGARQPMVSLYVQNAGAHENYDLKTRQVYKRKGYAKQFNITSGTIFSSRKLQVRDILAAIAIIINGAKGYSAFQLSRDLSVDVGQDSGLWLQWPELSAVGKIYQVHDAGGGARRPEAMLGP